MGIFKFSCIAASALLPFVSATPCPYGQLAERGELPAEGARNFFKARAEGEAHVERMISDVEKREFERQEKYYKRQLDLGGLLLGGGLLNGVLQPFTGVLEKLDVPVPQQFSEVIIPDAAHPYIAPKKGDVRGMCPTLNTMANHGYISRNGITNFAEAANACQITLGFGYDTCVFLSALGLLSGGDLPTGIYSIGGADSRVPNTFGPSLGVSHHGPFEVDNSISRIDTYHGNNANFDLNRWNEAVALSEKYGGFGAEMWAQERVMRYNQAITDNPTFDATAKWLAVTTAERVFIYRALPNGTHETLADSRNIAPFFMNETFPHEWFRRGTPYSLADTGVDIVDLLALSPEVTVPGQNQGFNNFVPLGVNLADFTPATATCFLGANILDVTPGDLAPGLAQFIDVFQAFINGAVAPFFASETCDLSKYGINGTSATSNTAGSSTTCNILVNGKYQC